MGSRNDHQMAAGIGKGIHDDVALNPTKQDESISGYTIFRDFAQEASSPGSRSGLPPDISHAPWGKEMFQILSPQEKGAGAGCLIPASGRLPENPAIPEKKESRQAEAPPPVCAIQLIDRRRPSA